MTTQGIEGIVIETRNYGATAAFWLSLGFDKVVETDHGSGQFVHPSGGPYVFVVEQHDRDLAVQPVVRVPDAAAFTPTRPLEFVQPFTAQHWGVLQALVHDPDGRPVSLEAADPNAPADHHG